MSTVPVTLEPVSQDLKLSPTPSSPRCGCWVFCSGVGEVKRHWDVCRSQHSHPSRRTGTRVFSYHHLIAFDPLEKASYSQTENPNLTLYSPYAV